MIITENISLKLKYSKEELHHKLETATVTNDFVRVSKNDEGDVCLEFNTNQKSDSAYIFIGNVENDELNGKIYNTDYLKFKSQPNKKNIILWVLLLGFDVLFIFGVPCIAIYLTTRKTLIALLCGFLALLFVTGYYFLNEYYQIKKCKKETLKFFEEL